MTTTSLRSTDPQQATAAKNPAQPGEGARAIDARRWLALVAKVLLPGGLFALSLFGALAHPAQAQIILDPTAFPATKLAPDLVSALNSKVPKSVKWMKEDGGGRYVKVIIMAGGSDPQLAALRSAIVAAKGSVYYRYQSVAGLSAMVPGSQILNIAARPDVESISPNRPATKTASLLETTTGTGGVRTTASTGARTGYDGSGVGIAVLDSGIFYKHATFLADGSGQPRRQFGRA